MNRQVSLGDWMNVKTQLPAQLRVNDGNNERAGGLQLREWVSKICVTFIYQGVDKEKKATVRWGRKGKIETGLLVQWRKVNYQRGNKKKGRNKHRFKLVSNKDNFFFSSSGLLLFPSSVFHFLVLTYNLSCFSCGCFSFPVVNRSLLIFLLLTMYIFLSTVNT